jgi:hypothetical protein
MLAPGSRPGFVAMPFSALRPTVVMADSSPLAAVGQLDLLFEYGRTAVGQTPIKAERLRSNAKRHCAARTGAAASHKVHYASR